MTIEQVVPDWPRIVASLEPDASGTVRIAGRERVVAGRSLPVLRAGVIALAAREARRLGRPVRLTVTEAGQPPAQLGVTGEGVVQTLGATGRMQTVGLAPVTGPCRVCDATNPAVADACARCGADDPYRVLPDPPRAPRLRLLLSVPPRTVVIERTAVLGRRPTAQDDELAVPIESAGRLLSRTHAKITPTPTAALVTDCGSANGVFVDDHDGAPYRIRSGIPHAIDIGATIHLGDVTCQILRED